MAGHLPGQVPCRNVGANARIQQVRWGQVPLRQLLQVDGVDLSDSDVPASVGIPMQRMRVERGLHLQNGP